jgi:hypothetical protein
MADTPKSKPKPRPTGKNQPGRGAGAATRRRPSDKSKLAKGAAARRLEAKRRRQRTILWSTVAVVALVALIGLIVWQGRENQPQTAAHQPVAPAALQAGRQAAGSEGVRTFPEAGRDHIGADEQPDNWTSNPPTSGDHLAAPLGAGVYNTEQDMRALVHNLEHGYVVILYKNLPQDQLDQLRGFVEDRGGSKLVLAPYSALDQDGVALAAWRNLEVMDRVNTDVVQAFVNDFMVPGATRSVAPEPGAA